MPLGYYQGQNIPKPYVFECRSSAITVFDVGSLQNAVTLDSIVVPRLIELNENLWSSELIFQNQETGEIQSAPSVKGNFQQRFWDYSDSDWSLVLSTTNYAKPASLRRRWGVYVLRKDVEVGERIYLPELIEDVRVCESWHSKVYAADGIATWDGSDLHLDPEPFKSTL